MQDNGNVNSRLIPEQSFKLLLRLKSVQLFYMRNA